MMMKGPSRMKMLLDFWNTKHKTSPYKRRLCPGQKLMGLMGWADYSKLKTKIEVGLGTG